MESNSFNENKSIHQIFSYCEEEKFSILKRESY